MQTGAWLLAVLLVAGNGRLAAQNVPDKELHGVWLMESYCWEGEQKVVCGENYSQVKVYMPDGEYACANVIKLKDGTVAVQPYEWGSYTFKDGVYSEMGRPPGRVIRLVDKYTYEGTFLNRHDVWKKARKFPDKLRDYVRFVCKAKTGPSEEMQDLIRKHIFK